MASSLNHKEDTLKEDIVQSNLSSPNTSGSTNHELTKNAEVTEPLDQSKTNNLNNPPKGEISTEDHNTLEQTVNLGYEGYYPLQDDTLLPWSACWDANYQCYYFWNTVTNETTYSPPPTMTIEQRAQYGAYIYDQQTTTQTEQLVPQYDTQIEVSQTESLKAMDAGPEVYPNLPQDLENSSEYSYLMRKEFGDPAKLNLPEDPNLVKGQFNLRTNKFQSFEQDKFTVEGKMVRQCNMYFDYSSFSEQRGLEGAYNSMNPHLNKRPKIPKKQLTKLIRNRKEKKLEAKKKWLLED